MKKIFFLWVIIFLGGIINFTYAQNDFGHDPYKIYNQNRSDIVNTEEINDPLRDGTYKVLKGGDNEVGGVLIPGDEQIDTHAEAQNTVLNVIKNIVNYALGLLSLVALIYLIYHGFLMVTAAGDDGQYKKGLKGLKFAAIALGGIGLSFFVISLIFWIIQQITTPTPTS